jgi:hypothetical protein
VCLRRRSPTAQIVEVTEGDESDVQTSNKEQMNLNKAEDSSSETFKNDQMTKRKTKKTGVKTGETKKCNSFIITSSRLKLVFDKY